MPYFKASTQYGDWHGTAAADEFGDNDRFEELFIATGKVDPQTEILIGFSIYISESSFFLTGYFHYRPADSGEGWFPTLNRQFQQDASPIDLKPIQIEITREEFFTLFKRFNAVMARQTIDSMTGHEYREKP